MSDSKDIRALLNVKLVEGIITKSIGLVAKGVVKGATKIVGATRKAVKTANSGDIEQLLKVDTERRLRKKEERIKKKDTKQRKKETEDLKSSIRSSSARGEMSSNDFEATLKKRKG